MFSQTNKTRGRGKRSILIVEDNVPLASCLEMLLESQGYEISRTSDGIGGLESIKLVDFDVILCDLVMPGLTGDKLHLAVRELKPYLCQRFIFMSGHPECQQSAGLVSSTEQPVLCKPFVLDELLNAINGVVQRN